MLHFSSSHLSTVISHWSKLPRYGLMHHLLAKAVSYLSLSSVYTSPLPPIISTFHIQPSRRASLASAVTLRRSWHWAQTRCLRCSLSNAACHFSSTARQEGGCLTGKLLLTTSYPSKNAGRMTVTIVERLSSRDELTTLEAPLSLAVRMLAGSVLSLLLSSPRLLFSFPSSLVYKYTCAFAACPR